MKLEALRAYLTAPRNLIHAALVAQPAGGTDDSVEFEVDVDLPQRPLFPIDAVERIRVRFSSVLEWPEVFLCRESFPQVPHLIRGSTEIPRQMCLYERPWSEETGNWAPGPFVERIRRWISGTADGSLHRPDQPLEPMIMPSPVRLVLPPLEWPTSKVCWTQKFHISHRGSTKEALYLVCHSEKTDDPNAVLLPVLFVRGPTSLHGVIRTTPATLQELEVMLKEIGGSLVDAICSEIDPLVNDLGQATLRNQHLTLVLQLPKQREAGGGIESCEYQAFRFASTVGDLLKVDTEYSKEGDSALFVPKKKERIRDPKKLAEVGLIPMSVGWRLSKSAAAKMNGVVKMDARIVAIGLGAIGSQIINNLWRGGFGTWSLVDHDYFEPHNASRHLFPSYAVGFTKASVMGAYMHQTLDLDEMPVAIPCNYLAPANCADALSRALSEADLILDFSASIAVERELAVDPRGKARRISAFLNQRGDELVILSEDQNRTNDLVWLEGEYFRAVAFDPRLRGHFDSVNAVAHRYGNSCRELSAVFRQDFVAMFAGMAAARVRVVAASVTASATVHRFNETTGEVAGVEIKVSNPLRTKIDDWRVLMHPDVVTQAYALRSQRLPSETGGVLLGLVDREHKFVIIAGLLPAPPDSHEWPTSFIRGCAGLANEVEDIGRRTLGNIVYIGEWHSHPPRHSSKPSKHDWTAIELCSPHMEADGLPTMMLILGSRGDVRLAAKALGKSIGLECRFS